jgi:hypothetical protein
MLRKIVRVLRQKNGNMGPFTAAFLLAVLLMLAFSMELWRLHALSTGVYDTMLAGTETAVTQNAPTLYAAQTDMAGDAYTYSSGGWKSDVDTSAITDVLANHLGLRQSGSDWVKVDGNGHELYRLAGVNVQVSNPYTPSGNPGTAPMLTVTVTYTLKTAFQSGIVLPVSTPMKVSVDIGGKF